MKYITLLITLVFMSSCSFIELLTIIEPDEGTISDYIGVVYDFNKTGDRVVVALNHDLTPSFHNRDPDLDEYNQFYSIAIYDSSGEIQQSIFEKSDYSCFNVLFFNDSIIFIGATVADVYTYRNNTCIIKYNCNTNNIDTLSQNGVVLNDFGRGALFSVSDNMKYLGVTYNSFSSFENGIYTFNSGKNDIATNLVAPYTALPNIIWCNDSIFLYYHQKANSVWVKILNEISEGDIEILPIDLSDSIHLDLIKQARIKGAKYVEYDKDEGIIIKNQNLDGL